MSDFLEASKLFETTFDQEYYFNSIEASFVKTNIIKIINAKKTPLIFLLGVPGVGKTYMLHMIKNELKDKKKILFSDEPFSTPESFLHFLLQGEEFDSDASLSELKEKAIDTFKSKDNLIMLDEAQLIEEKVLEFIRILSDSGYFYFLISMHEEEGRVLLSKKHFASRDMHKVTLGILKKNEILRYIQFELVKEKLTELAGLFTNKQAKQLEKLAKGNFRLLKQLLKHSFLIMDYAYKQKHVRYTRPTRCVITMAAIDIGVLHV